MRKLVLAAQFNTYWDGACTFVDAEKLVYEAFLSAYSEAEFSRWNTLLNPGWAMSFFLTFRDEPGIDLAWVIEALYEIR
ncbi:hypothetical protein [Burkholderia sp. LMU1-1-1.1]|uniref:hypothetical protein n=1 Tax=Burkholderia sp. LMU1-1-1.1 TaxID=3135266 RepID=UPI00343C9200